MPDPSFDPSLPADNAPILSAELRDQFNSLKDLIDGLPASGPMSDAIISRSVGNSAGIAQVNVPISNPPTQAQVVAIQDKLDALIGILSRA
jgi:hypothetical protein